eukprot:gene5959-biopygen13295
MGYFRRKVLAKVLAKHVPCRDQVPAMWPGGFGSGCALVAWAVVKWLGWGQVALAVALLWWPGLLSSELAHGLQLSFTQGPMGSFRCKVLSRVLSKHVP